MQLAFWIFILTAAAIGVAGIIRQFLERQTKPVSQEAEVWQEWHAAVALPGLDLGEVADWPLITVSQETAEREDFSPASVAGSLLFAIEMEDTELYAELPAEIEVKVAEPLAETDLGHFIHSLTMRRDQDDIYQVVPGNK